MRADELEVVVVAVVVVVVAAGELAAVAGDFAVAAAGDVQRTRDRLRQAALHYLVQRPLRRRSCG